ncbi:hypothetical protein [Pseudomonas caspiana]|uniref:hypothetical protein n=1 Tax=Pseudomonas caspiana TaxID=1451454 RepID=UPI001EE6C804|nr:hypothetical protein [Pseudomonas caspiana]
MSVFEILPLEAIRPARLGASRAAAREAMSLNGFPLERAYGCVDYFCEASIQLEYRRGDEVQFIGVSGNSQINFTFRGVDIFSLSATELFSLMADSDDSGPMSSTVMSTAFRTRHSRFGMLMNNMIVNAERSVRCGAKSGSALAGLFVVVSCLLWHNRRHDFLAQPRPDDPGTAACLGGAGVAIAVPSRGDEQKDPER